jgi:hypothetical protein
MSLNERSGTINYSQNSSSAAPLLVSYSGSFVLATPAVTGSRGLYYNSPRRTLSMQKAGTITTVTQTLTVKYYQRVYDAGTAGWCYYTGSAIDATPDSGDTTPNYTGAISAHSVVKILEIY